MCLGAAFPLWKYPGEIVLRAHRSLPRNFMGRRLSESLRNKRLQTYHTPQLCRIAQNQPPLSRQCSALWFPQKLVVTYLKVSHVVFFFTSLTRSLTLTLLMYKIEWASNNASKWQMGFSLTFKGLNFTCCINFLIWDPTDNPSLILASLTLETRFLNYKIQRYFDPLPWKIFMSPNLMCNGVNKLLQGWLMEYLLYFLSWNKRFSFRPLVLDVGCNDVFCL